jgi:hypothetical protein
MVAQDESCRFAPGASGAVTLSAPEHGNRTKTLVPCPTFESMLKQPPCFFTIE